ncbi:MAG: alpha/beta hydrolase [Polyangiaceae bacterium]
MATLARDGLSLHYDVEGKGTPILFIQGCGVGGEGWRPQLDVLGKTHEVAAFDNRGYGRSSPTNDVTVQAMTADVVALMDTLGWGSAHVVGHSLGGIIAQQFAFDQPARVRSLSLLCTFVRGRDGARPSAWMLWKAICMRVGTRASRRRAFLEMVMPAAALEAGDPAALAERLGKLFGRDLADQPGVIMKQVQALGAHDTSARLAELSTIPTLVVSAEHDRVAPVAQGKALAEAIGTARYVEIAGAAHGVTIQMAEVINELVGKHVAAVDEASA